MKTRNTRSQVATDKPRTAIEDIAAIGPELNDEELAFVAGGRLPVGTPRSKTYWADGSSDGYDSGD